MTQPLPVVHARGRTARCEACGVPCQGTLRGPGRIVSRTDDDGGVYGREPGLVLCPACHHAAWCVVFERLALIHLSRVLGYPARRSDIAARDAEPVQIHLWRTT